MTAAISGGIGLISGLFGMAGGMKSAGPGLGPMMYQMAGQEQQAAARAEAGFLAKESGMAYEQAMLEAAQKERQTRAFKEEQALKFASSGITLAGSPLGILEETRALGQQEADAIRRRGTQISGLYEMQGLQMLRQGSAAAFSGFAQSLQSQFEAKVQAYQQKNAAIQTGLSGIQAGVSGLGSLFGGKGGGAGYGYSGYSSPFRVP